jgi:hypothetical protein
MGEMYVGKKLRYREQYRIYGNGENFEVLTPPDAKVAFESFEVLTPFGNEVLVAVRESNDPDMEGRSMWLKSDRLETLPPGAAEAFDSMPPAYETKDLGNGYHALSFPEPAESPNADNAKKSPSADQAMRHNAGKPESDYIFTYKCGPWAAWEKDHPFAFTLDALGEVYRRDGDLIGGAHRLLGALRKDVALQDASVVDMIADTNTRGAKKYAQGNYLKGANWRQYFQAAARHADHVGRGQTHDAEGFSHANNFVFNVLMIAHCFLTGIGTDDRIRP